MADDQFQFDDALADGLTGLDPVLRWRLVLGEAADNGLNNPGMGRDAQAADAALEWLYGRDEGRSERDIMGQRRQGSGDGQGEGESGDQRGAGGGPSQLSVPDWINEVHRLFPKETIERLEQDAVDRYQIHEVVTNPEVLARIEPNPTLLKAVLQTKHLMNEDVLRMARNLVAKVVEKLLKEIAEEVKPHFHGAIDRRKRSPMKNSRNLDAKRTIARNLGNWRADEKKLYVDKVYFYSRSKRHSTRWQVILLVDQSGSMLDSTIHAAVTAACLWGIPSVKPHLAVFDTEVVDLTEDIVDPVETLMKVQLGGGTDICKAVKYGATLIQNPRRTIFCIISDFYEGGDSYGLVREVAALCQQETTVLGLMALDREANPAYDADMGKKLAEVGAHMGAMTPGELAAFVAEKVRG